MNKIFAPYDRVLVLVDATAKAALVSEHVHPNEVEGGCRDEGMFVH